MQIKQLYFKQMDIRSLCFCLGCNFIKKRLWHKCFPVNFATFLRTPFLTEQLRMLLLGNIKSTTEVLVYLLSYHFSYSAKSLSGKIRRTYHSNSKCSNPIMEAKQLLNIHACLKFNTLFNCISQIFFVSACLLRNENLIIYIKILTTFNIFAHLEICMKVWSIHHLIAYLESMLGCVESIGESG